MEAAKLALDFIKVLIWPALILLVIIAFKRPIASLLGTVGEFSVGGI